MGDASNQRQVEFSTKAGISIGLIDALVTVATVVRARLDFEAMICGNHGDRHQPVREALKDLSACQALRELIGLHDSEAMRIIHDAAESLRTAKGK